MQAPRDNSCSVFAGRPAYFDSNARPRWASEVSALGTQNGILPTLVVFGAHDGGRTFDHARTLLDGIAMSELATMTESGHSPMIETPDDFNAAFHAFLFRTAMVSA